MINKNTLFILILFVCSSVFGQKTFKNNYSYAEKTIDGKKLIGYTTDFDFDRKTLRKSWWKSSREYGYPSSHKTHYTVKLYKELTNGIEDIIIYTQSGDKSKTNSFFLGLDESQKEYKDQALKLLVLFKKNHYVDYLNGLIEEKQNDINNEAVRYELASSEEEKHKALTAIHQLQDDILPIRDAIRSLAKQ